jgi:hypothetical protein
LNAAWYEGGIPNEFAALVFAVYPLKANQFMFHVTFGSGVGNPTASRVRARSKYL